MSALLITALVGIIIPALVAIVTKESLPEPAKGLLLLFLSTASGVIAGFVATPPSSWAQWQAVLASVFVTFVASVSSDYAADKTGDGRALTERPGTSGSGRADGGALGERVSWESVHPGDSASA